MMDPGGTSGVFPGLETALAAVLRNYSPGDIGICEIEDKIQVAMPIPFWAEYPWYQLGDTASLSAAHSDPVVIYTVPGDRRYQLQDVSVQRLSGDNLLVDLDLIPPAMNVGGANTRMKLYKAGDSGHYNFSWPNLPGIDDTGIIDNHRLYAAGPKLLEPGTVIDFTPSGAGVAATVFTYWISGMMVPLIRA